MRSPLLIFIIPAIVIALEVALHLWRVPTHVGLDLRASRFVCEVGGAETGAMIDPGLRFRTLLIEDFRRLVLHPKSVEITATSGQRPAAWVKPEEPGPWIVTGQRAASRAWLQGESADLGALDAIRLDGRRLAVESRNERLTIAVDSPHELDLPIFSELVLAADFVDVDGPAPPTLSADHVQMSLVLLEDRFVRVESQEDGLTLSLELSEDGARRLFVGPVAVTLLELADRDPSGALRSTLLEDARLRYPDHPEIPERVIPANHLLELRGLRRSRLNVVPRDGLSLQLEGDAHEVVSLFAGRERHFGLSAADDLARHLPGGRLERWALILTMTMSVYSFVVVVRARGDRGAQKK